MIMRERKFRKFRKFKTFKKIQEDSESIKKDIFEKNERTATICFKETCTKDDTDR